MQATAAESAAAASQTSVTRWASFVGFFNGARFRSLIVDTNDGIIATAGIVEGLIGAGASTSTILIAALGALVGGGISVGAARYAEEAAERDALVKLIEEEERQISLSPAEELDELTAIYEGKGLSPALARQVAIELSERNALAAHTEAELGISLNDPMPRPLILAIASALAFASGNLILGATVTVSPTPNLAPTTFFAVVVSLALTSFALAHWGNVSVIRTVGRTLTIGIVTMAITFALGSLIEQF